MVTYFRCCFVSFCLFYFLVGWGLGLYFGGVCFLAVFVFICLGWFTALCVVFFVIRCRLRSCLYLCSCFVVCAFGVISFEGCGLFVWFGAGFLCLFVVSLCFGRLLLPLGFACFVVCFVVVFIFVLVVILLLGCFVLCCLFVGVFCFLVVCVFFVLRGSVGVAGLIAGWFICLGVCCLRVCCFCRGCSLLFCVV